MAAQTNKIPWTLFAMRDARTGLIVVRDADVKAYETRTVGELRHHSELRRRLARELRGRRRVYFRYNQWGTSGAN
ncbi:hypothetical protein V3W47_19275 [Deinococcus sp. YIM 134068]|uniref:hypothetical protein n=1 Tax=Deinococcus lichenicola TaxID=3118910 RepID=UPI002F941416